ncbi:hypothetical protein EXS71_04010 [Candidatus Uhrbacteria bacterium]|nr:hypothetical protein [Candidatus Uhrbacteria bacterium]
MITLVKKIKSFFVSIPDKFFLNKNLTHSELVCGVPALIMYKKEMRKKQVIGRWRHILKDLPDADIGDD